MTNISFSFFLNTHYFALADIQSATLPLAQGSWDAVTATLEPAGERATENLCMGGKLLKAASVRDPWPASNLFLSNHERNRQKEPEQSRAISFCCHSLNS